MVPTHLRPALLAIVRTNAALLYASMADSISA